MIWHEKCAIAKGGVQIVPKYVHFAVRSAPTTYHMTCSSSVHCICRFQKFDVPRLPHLDSPEFASKDDIMKQPIQIRKGYSYKVMLGRVFTSPL